MNGLSLAEDEKTLAEARIFPGSVIYFVSDDNPQNKSKKNTPKRREEGFKGILGGGNMSLNNYKFYIFVGTGLIASLP
jgi:hypothetical protein